MELFRHNPIAANGTYTVAENIDPGKPFIIAGYGTWGGGSLAVSWLDPVTNTLRAAANSTFTADFEVQMVVPAEGLSLVLTGATSPSIAINIANLQ